MAVARSSAGLLSAHPEETQVPSDNGDPSERGHEEEREAAQLRGQAGEIRVSAEGGGAGGS